MTTPEAPAGDIAAAITRLFVHPVKSCAGIDVKQALLTETGLEFDRTWMVVDAAGLFVTQRELPRMALVVPQLRQFDLVLHAPGMVPLQVAYERDGPRIPVRLWNDALEGIDAGYLAGEWFSDFLGHAVRLVRFAPGQRRLSSTAWTDGAEAPNQFADGFPMLVLGQASLDGLNQRLRAQGHASVGMERFRPNIVLGELPAHDEDRLEVLRIGTAEGGVLLQMAKPCPRCPIPNIDPVTAVRGTEVGDVLQSYRHDARVGGAVTFGMNAIVHHGAGHLLQVGQRVAGDYRFG